MEQDETFQKDEAQELFEEVRADEAREANKNADIEDVMFLEDQDIPHYVIGDYMMRNMNIKFYHENFYLYKNGVYEPNEKALEVQLIHIHKGLTRSKRKEIMNYIALCTAIEEQDINNDFVNFRNGLLDVVTGELLQHDPNIFSINQIHANYNEKVEKNEYIDKFLDDITCNNPIRKQAILEIIGYCMTSSTWIQKASVFYGPSAENGKSVLLKLIVRLIGEENTSHISLHKLQDRFAPSDLADKLLNTTSELPKTDIKSVDIFKGLVTGDRMAVDRKYKKIINIKPYAKHIFATNSLPVVADETNGYYRRLNILLFEKKFTIEEQNNFKEENLLTPEALDYLAYISMQSYLKLLEEGRRDFANYEESNKLINSYKADNNSVLLFLESDIVKSTFENGKRIKKTSFYEIYKKWCSDNNYIADKSKEFHKKLEESKQFILKFYDGYENYQKREDITANID